MKVNHSTLSPLLRKKVIVCHPLFEVEGLLTHSEAFSKYFVCIGDNVISFKIGNVKRVDVVKENRDIYLHGADLLD